MKLGIIGGRYAVIVLQTSCSSQNNALLQSNLYVTVTLANKASFKQTRFPIATVSRPRNRIENDTVSKCLHRTYHVMAISFSGPCASSVEAKNE